ncbi:MAG TPA: universal stress protein [Streptosporangiaceae bacterium]|jgi:nucleotide-binding universal stress UspA family protein|nr:universal stress protein [Streptosporangiaceae bacterium]
MPFGRRRFDPQPTAQAAVLLASSGSPFSRAAIRRAHELADGQPVAVLSILKVYGSSFGLPNPGLMPTRREREEQVAIVQRAIKDLERLGGSVDGQIAATRSAGRMIAKVARVRKVDWVVMDSPNATGMRKIIEGELTGIVRRRLEEGTTLEVVGAKL